jgi:hypothetical protein
MQRARPPSRFVFTWRGFFVLVAVVFVMVAVSTFVLQRLFGAAP